MHQPDIQAHLNSIENVDKYSWFTKLFYTWLNPIIKTGSKMPLQANDLNFLPFSISVDQVLNTVYTNAQYNGNVSYTLEELIFSNCKTEFIIGGIGRFLAMFLEFTQPFLLQYLIKYITSYQSQNASSDLIFNCYMLLFGFITTKLAVLIFNNVYFLKRAKLIGLTRSIILVEIGRRYLKLASDAQNASANTISLVATDTGKIADVIMELHGAWISIFICFVSMGLLIYNLGIIALAGVATLCVFALIPMLVTKNMIKFRRLLHQHSDKRLSSIKEAFHSIKVIKLYSWELRFLKQILDMRSNEMHAILRLQFLRSIVGLCYVIVAPITQAMTYISVSLYTGSLEANHVYATLLLFNTLRLIMFYLPFTITILTEMKLALQRINKFLLLPTCSNPSDYLFSEDVAIRAENASLSWSSMGKPVLQNLTFQIHSNSLVAIAGSVGSGKSSFIYSVLNELVLLSGNFRTKQMSYGFVPQQSWVYGGTLRDNILFGKPFNQDLYLQTLKVCALNRDLDTFASGDQTIIGDNGTSLSGGQKQRINIARAVYSQAECVLLDDVLSAVDTHLSQYLFDSCISNFLRNKTVLIVSNQLHVLQNVEQIIVFDQGKIINQGTFQELVDHCAVFQSIIKVYRQIENQEGKSITTGNKPNRRFSYLTNPQLEQKSIQKPKTIVKQRLSSTSLSKTLNTYIQLCGHRTLVIWIAFLLGQNASQFIADRWLVTWSSHKLNYSEETYIYAYVVMVIIVTVVNAIGLMNVVKISNSIAIKVHNQALTTMFHGCSTYFDTTPVGKIINRFSKEQVVVDLQLSAGLNSAMYQLLNFIGYVILIAVYNSWFAATVPVIFLSFYKLQSLYRCSSKELKTLESDSRGPILTLYSTLMSGNVMIRSYRQENVFIQKMALQIDLTNRIVFISQCSLRWLGEYTDLLATISVSAVVLITIIQIDNVNISLAALCIVYAASLSASLVGIVNSVVDAETNLGAVRLVLH